MSQPRALVATIPPRSGGVPQMTRFIAHTLESRGIQPILSYYEPYSSSPHLSVPGFQLLNKRIGSETRNELNGYQSHAIGAWLPELEFTHYLPTRAWQDLMESSDYYISVSGSCLAGLPFALREKKFVTWVASPWGADREDRVNEFPWYRKILDKGINGPIVRRLEQTVLKKGKVLALSHYTQRELNAVAKQNICNDVLSIPIDTQKMTPDVDRVKMGTIGFVGRLDDPRKNIELFLQTLTRCRELNSGIAGVLIGGEPDPTVMRLYDSPALKNSLEVMSYVDRVKLISVLQTLDVFLIPSHQEGLCIAALEAMACGCPVISTRCGGPEEFVRNYETGYLVESCAEKMAEVILNVIRDRNLRGRLSYGARRLVQKNYSQESALQTFWNALEDTYH